MVIGRTKMGYVISDADLVAKYLLYKQPMTQKKLHKLLYFTYAWYLYTYNDFSRDGNYEFKIFPNKFQAWVHGPVYSTLYSRYKNYSFQLIQLTNSPSIDKALTDFLDQIIRVYGALNSNTLETLSHKELSWKKARANLTDYEISNNFLNDSDIYIQMDINYASKE